MSTSTKDNAHSLWAKFSKTTALAALALAAATPAFAQNAEQTNTVASNSEARSSHAEVSPTRLLELMVQHGIVSRQEADALLAEAAQAPAVQAPLTVAQSTEPGVITVPYIPENVRNQIREDVRRDVMAQAQSEHWAAPGAMPEWTQRVTLSGDIRVRGENTAFDDGNYPFFTNFPKVNAGNGLNLSPSGTNPPLLNTTRDRFRPRLRARFGIAAIIDDGVTADLRIATGNDTSPVSTNQTLGGNGGGKYALWLDRAAVHFTPFHDTAIDVGRFANPFWTSDLVFDADMNFDGVALRGHHAMGEDVSLFGTIGAFPFFNTDFNFGSNTAGAFDSEDKYLAAVQAGFDFHRGDDFRLKAAVGYFNFLNAEGEFSSPCLNTQDVCDTDSSRPAFAQFGNTYRVLRNLAPTGVDPQNQYFGLASKFEIVDLRAQADFRLGTLPVRIEGDYAINVGFDKHKVEALAINPALAPGLGISPPGGYEAGNQAWRADATFGQADLASRGDWNFSIGYRYLETDAVLDAFTDSDFHLGGTNAQGFTLGAGIGIGHNTSLSGRWLSANEVTGAPYAADVMQLDLNTKF